MQCTDTDIVIGRCIRAARERRGLSSTDLAGKLSSLFPDQPMTDSAIRKYERGERVFPYSLIVRISIALDCSIQTLTDGTDPRHPMDRAAPALEEFGILSDAEHEAFRYMATRWDGDRHALIIFLRLYMALPPQYRRDAPLSLMVQAEAALRDGAITRDQLPDNLDYLEQQWRNLY